MFSICVHGYATQESLNYWSFILFHWVPEQVYLMRPDTGLVTNEKIFVEALVIETASDLPADQPLVMLSPVVAKYLPGDIPLPEFTYPENPIFMFGSNRMHLSQDDLGTRVPDYSVYIPGQSPDLYDFMAGAVVLYDQASRNG